MLSVLINVHSLYIYLYISIYAYRYKLLCIMGNHHPMYTWVSQHKADLGARCGDVGMCPDIQLHDQLARHGSSEELHACQVANEAHGAVQQFGHVVGGEGGEGGVQLEERVQCLRPHEGNILRERVGVLLLSTLSTRSCLEELVGGAELGGEVVGVSAHALRAEGVVLG